LSAHFIVSAVSTSPATVRGVPKTGMPGQMSSATLVPLPSLHWSWTSAGLCETIFCASGASLVSCSTDASQRSIAISDWTG
jgi:hypothetical protein